MTELDLHTIVAGIHGNPIKTLNELLKQKEYHDQIPIQRAVSYIIQFGGAEARKIAAQAASVMNLGIDSN